MKKLFIAICAIAIPSLASCSGVNNPSTGYSVYPATAAIVLQDGSKGAPSTQFVGAATTGIYNSTRPVVSVAAANWNTSTNIVTFSGHGLWFNDQVRLTTTGSLPSGLSASTTYYVIWLSTYTFALGTNYSTSSSNTKSAFTTQGTGTHTLTPVSIDMKGSQNTTSGNVTTPTPMVGLTAGATAAVFATPYGLLVGQPHSPVQYPTEVIHAEGISPAGDPSFNTQDITITNSGTGAARFIATSGGLPSASGTPASPNVQAYLLADGSSNSGNWWSGGPSATNSGGVLIAGATNFVLAVESGSPEEYIYNDQTHARVHFNYGSSGTEYATLSDTGTLLTGTNTNDSAPAGFIGEYISSATTGSGAVFSAGTGNFADIAQILLKPGDWDVEGLVVAGLNGASGYTSASAGILTVSGNSSSGQVYGTNFTDLPPPTGNYDTSATIPRLRASLTSNTTYYLKVNANMSGGSPKFFGNISARRVR